MHVTATGLRSFITVENRDTYHLGGYVVLAGADYVDSLCIKWLERAVGVRCVVVTKLT